jgi:hypothetical protein
MNNRAVDDDLEDTSPGRDQGEGLHVVLELGQDLGRQTDGTVGIASDGAVFDGDLHSILPGRCAKGYLNPGFGLAARRMLRT